MAVYIIAYDLNRETVRPKITDAIHKYGAWAMLSESSYAISTSQTPQEVYNNLKSMLDDNDNLYVVSLSKPWAGYGPKDVIGWLESELP